MNRFVLNDYRLARRAMSHALGRRNIERLHRESRTLDWATVMAMPTLFIGTAIALTNLPWPIWPLFLLLQGFVIQAFGYVVHDLFVHRRVGGRFGYFIGAVLELPLSMRRTWYARYHTDHHDTMNSDTDPEEYKQDLNSRARKLFFLSLPGTLLIMARRLAPAPASACIKMTALTAVDDEQERWQLRFERVLAVAWTAGLIVAAFWWWELVVFGYLLPFIVATPIASGLRTILEHAECDPKNVFHCATFYTTGWITGLLFLWDAGDCHIVHHIYPGIPWYRMRHAVKVMTPVLIAQGARPRSSLLELLWKWFGENRQHRTLWQ